MTSSLNRPIAFHAGNDIDLSFPITDAAGDPVDTITGSTFTWKLVPLSAGSDEPADGATASVSYASPTEIELDEVNKAVTVHVEAADTASLASGRYYQELEETRANGNTLVIATGVVQLRPNV